MRTLVISERARRVLSRQHVYISQDSVEADERVTNGILAAMDQLCAYPKLGRVGVIAQTREFAVKPYIIVYRANENYIYVLDVRHGSRKT